MTEVEPRPEFASRSWRTGEDAAIEGLRGSTRLSRRTRAFWTIIAR